MNDVSKQKIICIISKVIKRVSVMCKAIKRSSRGTKLRENYENFSEFIP